MLHVQPDHAACLRPEPSQARRDWTWTLLQPGHRRAHDSACDLLLLRTGSKVSLAGHGVVRVNCYWQSAEYPHY